MILQCMEDFKLKIKSTLALNTNSSIFSFHLNFSLPVGERLAFLDRIRLEMASSVKALVPTPSSPTETPGPGLLQI